MIQKHVEIVASVVKPNLNKYNMKNKKMTKKNTFKPAYVVDITKCEDLFDMLLAFGKAKQQAGQPITNEELEAIIDDNSVFVTVVHECQCNCEAKPKKLPWYKRFWRWLTRKN